MALLSLLLAVPAAGAVLVAVLPEDRPGLARALSQGVALVNLAVGVVMAWAFDPSLAGPQLVATLGWTVQPGIPSTLGVDGLSLPLVMLTTAMMPVVMAASGEIHAHVRSWHAWLLLLEAAVLGVFLAQDWALFYAAWELTLVPLFFLVGRWGADRRGEASITFLQYTMGGSIFTLLALLWLVGATGSGGMAMAPLAEHASKLAPPVQATALAVLAIGFLVKLPAIPLHGWLPLTYTQAPTPATMVMSGLLAKMAVYGLMRAAVMLPDGAALLAPWAAGLGALGVVHGGLLAWRQDDLKAMVAWSSFAHMSLMWVSWATLSEVGWRGLVLQMVAHGVVAPALFFVVGALERRQHTRSLARIGGVLRTTPALGAALAVLLAASFGLPGLAGFPGELHAAVASWRFFSPLAPAVLLGALLWTATGLRALDRVLFGPSRGRPAAQVLTRWEWGTMLPLTVAALVLGWVPDRWSGPSASAVEAALSGPGEAP
jgi:NADH-quinone oxidoreductase subunit M